MRAAGAEVPGGFSLRTACSLPVCGPRKGNRGCAQFCGKVLAGEGAREQRAVQEHAGAGAGAGRRWVREIRRKSERGAKWEEDV